MTQVELAALRQCCANYEQAILKSQAETKTVEKELKQVNAKLNKLIHIVTHSARNSETILNQAGITGVKS